MNTPIRIKSSANGLRIIMNPEYSFEELEKELRLKLTDNKKFFGNMKVSVAFEGKDLTRQEQDSLCDLIEECTDLDLISIIDLPDAEQPFEHCFRIISEEYKKNDVCFIKNSVINQDFIDSEKDIIIIGDVHPGCTIISAKSIYVFGGLYGEAYAGVVDGELHITDSKEMILAMEMAPEELRIGSLCYEPAKKPRWGIKPKLLPQVAYVSNDKINIEPYTKELLKRITD